MKKLKLSLIVFVMSLGFAHLSFANPPSTSVRPQAAPPSIRDATTAATAGSDLGGVGDTMTEGGDKVADGVKDDVFKSAYEKAGEQAENDFNNLESVVGAAGSSLGALGQAVNALGQAAASCKQYTEVGVDCCMNPKNCGGDGESVTAAADEASKETSQQAEQAAAAASGGGGGGGGGAAAQCLSALPGVMAMTGKSKGAGLACGMIRDGHEGKKGCSNVCSEVASKTNEIINAANNLMSRNPSASGAITNFVKQARQHGESAGESSKECSSKTQTGQQAANAQAGSGMQAMQGLMQCLQSLMNGEETQDELDKPEDPKVATNCASPAERAANPDYCLGYGAGDTGGTSLSKTSGSNGLLADGGDLATDLPDDPRTDDTVAGTPADPLGNGNSNAKTTGNPGFAALGGVGGGFGANRKTGKGKGKKGKDLIGGYKNTRGGGSGGYGGRRPASKFKPFKFSKKKKKKKNKKALAALSKLMKAGISPDQSGSIFVRASKRFASSSAKEKLFDARKNKSLWMDKRK